MTIDIYFLEYVETFHEMKKALKRYLEAKDDIYYITGGKIDETPKAFGNGLSIDDLLINIEDLKEEYKKLTEDYETLRNIHKIKISELNNPIHKIILEYCYLDMNDDKKVLKSIREYHNKDYSESHFRRLKSQAVKEFEKLIQNDTI